MNNRRGFLKRIGQTIAGLMIVPTVIKAKKPGLGKDILSANPALKGSIDLDDEKMANAILECYEELGRPIGPLAQIRKELRKQNFPKEHIMD